MARACGMRSSWLRSDSRHLGMWIAYRAPDSQGDTRAFASSPAISPESANPGDLVPPSSRRVASPRSIVSPFSTQASERRGHGTRSKAQPEAAPAERSPKPTIRGDEAACQGRAIRVPCPAPLAPCEPGQRSCERGLVFSLARGRAPAGSPPPLAVRPRRRPCGRGFRGRLRGPAAPSPRSHRARARPPRSGSRPLPA